MESTAVSTGSSIPPRRKMVLLGFAGLLSLFSLYSLLSPSMAWAQGRPHGDPPRADPGLTRHLRQNARGTVSMSTQKSTRFAGFVRVSKGGDLHPGHQHPTPAGKAKGFFEAYGGLFGVQDAATELVPVKTFSDKYGATHITYQQMYKNVPVFAAMLRAHLDTNNAITAVNGVFVPEIALNLSPTFSAEHAAERALAAVLAQPPRHESTGTLQALAATDLTVLKPTLYVYQDGLIQGVEGPNKLVYEVEVTDGHSVREVVYIHAHTGKLVNRFSRVAQALFRRLFEEDSSNQIWQEGDPFPGTLNQDQQNIVNFSRHAYNFFFNTFGRDSYDGLGAEMQAIANDLSINCPNANWNGVTTNYCNGYTADDVVGHEWSHAYTTYTHNLILQWQPGALNESYADIWGEVIDRLNGVGTDTPDTPRAVDACSTHTTPLPQLTITSPEAIAGDYLAGAAAFGPPLSAAGVTGSVVLGEDGVDASSDACTALVNGAAVAGKIVLVDRGTCSFTSKVKHAQNAGAIGVIVADNVPGPVAGMGGADPTIAIPAVRVSLDTGNLLKDALEDGVTATLHTVGAQAPDGSYRWLIGEDASGGAFRDMWAPTCTGHPGKVTDAPYHCADSGGTHTNAGVPNHGFTLLVDGGTYNGHTVQAIGLVKAAHLYWVAQSVYQTPTTDFNSHADALQTACEALTGVPLTGLSVTGSQAGPAGQAITARDCAAVDSMIAAVELRTTPCDFQLVLQQNPPPLCPNIKNPPQFFVEDFEHGLKGWTLTSQGVYAGWPNLQWTPVASLPDRRPGAAAFAADPQAGTCEIEAYNISGVMRLESPSIRLPHSQTLSRYILSFDHYVATEAGFDGGNLKLSINGGPYAIVPPSAYQFNPYNTTLVTAPEGNTNPLAGQPAFSGTDEGSVSGSWGQSQVNLTRLGVKPGDTIRLRYDFGIDGCGGNDGWYVDNVTVSACNVKKSP